MVVEEEGETMGVRATTASINAFLLAYARFGRVDRAFATYDQFTKLGCDVDGDTSKYLMESVALDIQSGTPLYRHIDGEKPAGGGDGGVGGGQGSRGDRVRGAVVGQMWAVRGMDGVTSGLGRGCTAHCTAAAGAVAGGWCGRGRSSD